MRAATICRATMLGSTLLALSVFLHIACTRAPRRPEAHPTGLRLASREEYESYGRAPLSFGAARARSIPPTYVFRDLPPIGHQGSKQYSCVAWAVGYMARSYNERRRHNWQAYTKDHLISPAFLYNLAHDPSNDCITAGMHFERALNVAVSIGAVPMSLFDYDPNSCDAKPDTKLQSEAQKYVALGWGTVSLNGIEDIQSHLLLGVPTVIGMRVGTTFQDWLGNQTYQGLKRGDGDPIAHAVTIVGYDNERKAFRAANSWGTKWGDAGFVWLGYDLFKRDSKDVLEAYVAYPNPDPPESPTPGVPVAVTATTWELTAGQERVVPLSTTVQRWTRGELAAISAPLDRPPPIIGLLDPTKITDFGSASLMQSSTIVPMRNVDKEIRGFEAVYKVKIQQ